MSIQALCLPVSEMPVAGTYAKKMAKNAAPPTTTLTVALRAISKEEMPKWCMYTTHNRARRIKGMYWHSVNRMPANYVAVTSSDSVQCCK